MKLLSTRSRFTNSPMSTTRNCANLSALYESGCPSPSSVPTPSSKWTDGRFAAGATPGVLLKVQVISFFSVYCPILDCWLSKFQSRIWSTAILSLCETCWSGPTWRTWKKWPTTSTTKTFAVGNWPESEWPPTTAPPANRIGSLTS